MSAELLRTIAKNNAPFSKSHKPSPAFSDFPNMKAAAIISCMDPRANPNEFWSFGEEGPIVIRNAGGRVTEDTLRSLRVLAGIMSNGQNTLGAVAVVHHTDCGLCNFSNERIRELLKVRVGLEGERGREVDGLDFCSWSEASSPEESVKWDMDAVRKDPYLPRDLEIVGFVYDVFSGETKEVV